MHRPLRYPKTASSLFASKRLQSAHKASKCLHYSGEFPRQWVPESLAGRDYGFSGLSYENHSAT